VVERIVESENNGLQYRRKRTSGEGENRDKRIAMMESTIQEKKKKEKKKQ
jgi:hypothetical protein